MLSEFSQDGRYFAHLTKDNKLEIWQAATNKLVHKFALTAPCTCLQFVQDSGRIYTPRKKKKRQSLEASSVYIALGTTTGDLLVYSITKGDLDFTIKSDTNQSIGCLTWSSGSLLYSGVNENVVTFNLHKQIVGSKWKSGTENLTSLLSIPNSPNLLTASCEIKLWDTSDKQLLKTFTRHKYEVTLLRCIPSTQENSAAYFVSGTKSEHYVSVWNLSPTVKDKSAIGQLVLEDVPSAVSLYVQNGTTNFVAVTRGGVAQFFRHIFNGKRKRPPLQPEVTIHIANEKKKNSTLTRIPVLGATFTTSPDLSLLLCRGSENLIFESVGIDDLKTEEKVQCWIRKDSYPKKKQQAVLQNGDSTMEKRLQKLNLNDSWTVPKELDVKDLPHFLVKELRKALRKGRRGVLKGILTRFDSGVIRPTLKKLRASDNALFLKQIVQMTTEKSLTTEKGILWLKYFIENNAELLVEDKQMSGLLHEIEANIEERVLLHSSFLRLNGKLDLLNAQINKNQEKTAEDEDNFLMVNQDQVDIDIESDIDGLEDSDEEIEWVDEEEEEEIDEEEEKSSGSSDMETLETEEDEEQEEELHSKWKNHKNKNVLMEID